MKTTNLSNIVNTIKGNMSTLSNKNKKCIIPQSEIDYVLTSMNPNVRRKKKKRRDVLKSVCVASRVAIQMSSLKKNR